MCRPGAFQESCWCTKINELKWYQTAAREEKEEDFENAISVLSEEDDGHPETAGKAAPDANKTQRAIQVLLKNLHHGCAPGDKSSPTPVNNALDLLCDWAVLSKGQERLLQSQDKLLLDVVFQACISAMIGVLNIFLNPKLSFTWRELLIVVATAQGHGVACTCSIWTWVLDFVWEERLPFYSYGYTRQTVLKDKDLLKEIQEELLEKLKAGFIKAQDVCDIVAGKKIQNMFLWMGIHKPGISQSTAQRWLANVTSRWPISCGSYSLVSYRLNFA